MYPVDGKPAESAPDIVISSTPPAVQKVSNGTAGGKSAAASADTKSIPRKMTERRRMVGSYFVDLSFSLNGALFFCCSLVSKYKT